MITCTGTGCPVCNILDAPHRKAMAACVAQLFPHQGSRAPGTYARTKILNSWYAHSAQLSRVKNGQGKSK